MFLPIAKWFKTKNQFYWPIEVFVILNMALLNTERSYKTRLNSSDCQSKIPNARIGLVDYQRSYFSAFKFPQLRIERT